MRFRFPHKRNSVILSAGTIYYINTHHNVYNNNNKNKNTMYNTIIIFDVLCLRVDTIIYLCVRRCRRCRRRLIAAGVGTGLSGHVYIIIYPYEYYYTNK